MDTYDEEINRLVVLPSAEEIEKRLAEVRATQQEKDLLHPSILQAMMTSRSRPLNVGGVATLFGVECYHMGYIDSLSSREAKMADFLTPWRIKAYGSVFLAEEHLPAWEEFANRVIAGSKFGSPKLKESFRLPPVDDLWLELRQEEEIRPFLAPWHRILEEKMGKEMTGEELVALLGLETRFLEELPTVGNHFLNNDARIFVSQFYPRILIFENEILGAVNDLLDELWF